MSYAAKYGMIKTLLAAVCALACASSAFVSSAQATPIAMPPTLNSFVINPGPFTGELKLFFDDENANTNNFNGTVGGQHSGPIVNITTLGNVHNGAGFAEINPVHTGTLTSITFTPQNDLLFNDFSFRGQLDPLSLGNLLVKVTDQNGLTQTFAFSGLGQNDDFGRHGILSNDGETIASVQLIGNFEEIKQIEFSTAPGVTIPDGGTTVMLLGLALSGLGLVRRFLVA